MRLPRHPLSAGYPVRLQSHHRRHGASFRVLSLYARAECCAPCYQYESEAALPRFRIEPRKDRRGCPFSSRESTLSCPYPEQKRDCLSRPDARGVLPAESSHLEKTRLAKPSAAEPDQCHELPDSLAGESLRSQSGHKP